MNPTAMFKLTYGLFVVSAKDERDNGCIINTAIQAASTPNQMSICLNKSNFTHDMILKTKKFNVSVISEEASFDLFKHFGFQSGRDVNKFDNFTDCTRSNNGLYYITKGTNAYMSVNVTQCIDLGSHTMFIGEIIDMDVLSEVPSITYAYYFENIKPKPQPKQTNKVVWRCKICGYEYEGENLPDDFICPICKHPAADFEKV